MTERVPPIENTYVLALIQALYGALSSNVRAVHLSRATETSVTIHFLLEQESADDREEIDDVVAELQALLASPLVDLDLDVRVGRSFEALRDLPGRGVYHRKESGLDDEAP